MKLDQHVCVDEILHRFGNGSHQIKKSMSLGQILEKPYVCSRGHSFSPITMKLGQNICLDEISEEF